MPQLKTPSTTPSVENGSSNGLRTLNQVSYALDAMKDLYNVRLDAMDKAISVAHEDLVRVPTDVDKAVAALDKVIMEKFATVAQRFTVVQTQFDEREKALAAALLTAEKAVGKQAESFTSATTKSENAATKQSDALGERLNSVEKNSNDKHIGAAANIARLDNLFAALLANRQGRGEHTSEMWAKLLGAAAVGGGLIALLQFLRP